MTDGIKLHVDEIHLGDFNMKPLVSVGKGIYVFKESLGSYNPNKLIFRECATGMIIEGSLQYAMNENGIQFNTISEEPILYASVIDFNKASEEIINEYSYGHNKSTLLKSILESLIFNIEVLWKIDANVIQFSEYSEYLQQGFPNSVSDIAKVEPKDKSGK